MSSSTSSSDHNKIQIHYMGASSQLPAPTTYHIQGAEPRDKHPIVLKLLNHYNCFVQLLHWAVQYCGVQPNRQWGFGLGVAFQNVRAGESNSSELEEPKILSLPFPLPSGAWVLTKHHGIRDGYNKNKPFLWLLCWQRISILWVSSVNGKK